MLTTEEQLATHFYARVSSRDQDPKSQVEAAITRGISPANIHIETASGARHERPVLTKLLAKLERGDVLMTFRLDRLGRSLVHLVKVLEDLETRGIGFETLDGVSTQGSTGKLVLHILGSVAQFERQLLIERTMAGLKAARAEGRTGGRRRHDDTSGYCHRPTAYDGGQAQSPRGGKNVWGLGAIAVAQSPVGRRARGGAGRQLIGLARV